MSNTSAGSAAAITTLPADHPLAHVLLQMLPYVCWVAVFLLAWMVARDLRDLVRTQRERIAARRQLDAVIKEAEAQLAAKPGPKCDP